MKHLVKIFATAIALVIAIVTHAQETVSFTPEDLEILRQLACEDNRDRLHLEPPIAEINTLESEPLAVYSLESSGSQIESTYTKAVQIRPELKIEKSVREFCADY